MILLTGQVGAIQARIIVETLTTYQSEFVLQDFRPLLDWQIKE